MSVTLEEFKLGAVLKEYLYL
jgi:hypothetical protein